CSNGEKKAVLNLPVDHGQYLQGNPQINTQDSKLENLEGFGICKLTNKKCVPQLSPWLNGNQNKKIWNQATLKMEATVVDTESYCVCLKNQGIISANSSGQTVLKQDPHSVYITTDRTAIVVNGIHFDIYNPNSETVNNTVTIKQREDWYTIMEYTMTEVEFSLSQALLGVKFELEDFSREEVSSYSNQSVKYPNGKSKTTPKKNKFVDSHTPSGSKAGNTVILSSAIWLAESVLQQIADAVEYTHVTFYFQKANTGKRRVVLLGGTKSDYWKYVNYEFYKMERSYLYHIVPENLTIVTRNGMKETVKDLILYYISKIKKGQSNAKLLVSEEEMWLKDNEYYDLTVYLSPQRKADYHQMILYSYNSNLCQMPIIYPEESLTIIKRKGIYPFDKRIKLIELIYSTWTLQGDKKFWNIFDKALKQQYMNNKKPSISDPSNATFTFSNLKDEIPKGGKPKSAFDLMKTNH
ncbi:PAAR-like protein, partial [Clostridium sp. HBUAS56010]|uniref:PAAR-like protein n=1 Tax=Clostridium sp. HBUAS56010 TaxID=2571127 RepID=UPI0011782648